MSCAFDFYFARSGNSLRAAIALELSGQMFNKHKIDMSQKAHKSEAFLNINPAGHVPVLVITKPDGRATLPQSGAIMEYLFRQFCPDLIPKDEIARARCNAVFIAALSDVAMQNAFARYLSSHRDVVQFIFSRMLSDLRALFEPVKKTPYLCGYSPTIADYAHFPVIYMRALQFSKLEGLTHVLDWLDRMSADAAVARATSYCGLQLEA
ncbi:MAG: glutathione S-transferase family protein [Pseudomonadota bacterium]